MKNKIIERSIDLCKFLDKGVSVYHATENICDKLLDRGFKELLYKDSWCFEGKGFVKFNNSSVFAFSLNKERIKDGIKFILSHLDSPSLKIKTGSDILNRDGILYLNVEVYGGAILNTWLDRGLSIAGRVFIKSENYKFSEVLIDFEDDIAFIPNCPIHLNREINSGFSLNRQTHILPIVLTNSLCSDASLKGMISSYLGVSKDDVLDFDLYLYDTQKASIIGFNKEFIQSKRIDDLAMSEASLYAFMNSCDHANKFICMFDGEEIGSSMSEGAYSNTLLNILDRLYELMNITTEDKLISLNNSFIISADMAHAYNSSYSEKFDENNRCVINKGIAIKSNSNRSYVTTGESSSYIKSLCNKIRIPYQVYYNRSDIQGGSTLGPIITKYLSIKGVDLGNPMFAMHSCRETSGVIDHHYISELFMEYFK